jgi:hypothetical protein
MISFRDLHDRMRAAGIDVGIENGSRGHAITLVDPDSLRSIRFPVTGAGFDGAAAALVASAQLRELLRTPDIRHGGVRVQGAWPELAALST